MRGKALKRRPVEQNHWSELGRATSVGNSDLLGPGVAGFCRWASASHVMKFILVALASLLPAVAYSIDEGGDTKWPKATRIEVGLHLSAAVGTNGQVKVSGDLLIKNSSDTPLTIQSPQNRRVLAFLVFDPLGNPVAPKGFGKADPGFETHSLSPRSTHTYHFETLDFITGSALFRYDLSPGKTYRVLAVYRPAGPNGPGFASQETNLEIPNLGGFAADSHSAASESNAVVAWGEPVEGVSTRLRADKKRWATNETPTFKFDVRNQGQRKFGTFQGQELGRLEVDGVWYSWTGPIDLKGSGLPAGREYHDIPVSLGSYWKAAQEWRDKTQAPPPQIPLNLLPGKHTIRFASQIQDSTVKPKPQSIYVPSNPVEIEIWSNPVQ